MQPVYLLSLTIWPEIGRKQHQIYRFYANAPVTKSLNANHRLPFFVHGMEEVVGSIPTRSTIFSTTCRYPPFDLGVIWCQNVLTSSKLGSGQGIVREICFPLPRRL
jgi:hypothetical protein